MTSKLLITGAASGIGRAVALQASDAFACILVDRNAAALADLAEQVGGAKVAALDVTDPEAWAALQRDSVLDGLAGAVICAGVSDAAPLTEMTFEAWRRVLSVNLDGAFLSLQAALRAMPGGGAIVAIGSATGEKAAPQTAAYGAAKAGLAQLVRVAALEAAAQGVRVNLLSPGGVKTPMFSDQDWFKAMAADKGEDAAWGALSASVPLGRLAEPEEVARAALWLLGDDAAMATGATLRLDGGYGL